MAYNSSQLKKAKRVFSKNKIKRLLPLYLCVCLVIICFALNLGYSFYSTKLKFKGTIVAKGERGEAIDTTQLYNFYLFLFVDGVQIEWEQSSFWGAFEIASVRQDNNDSTIFYIPEEELQRICSTYANPNLDISKNGNAVLEYAPNAYYATDNITLCEYKRIYFKDYIKITDVTNLEPHRVNMYITSK